MDTQSEIKILIIDDDEAIREYLSVLLDDEGYTVMEAEDGSAGLNLLTTFRADIIITDLVMPEKEGIETIREIKAMYSDCKIIAMSGAMNRDNYLLITKALGANAVIKKPFERETVLDTVKNLLL